ncbi:MAG TPA: AAA family ATPase [Fodinibius sp.]|nr:AAA family ATPase [Fodinibius sp.]
MNSSLIEFLKNPDAYPHDPERITHIQTHISHVFMAGSYVYKVKKPVNFEFLDFSTLEKRKYYCGREVELNRRLCSGIYLGVVTISSSNDDYQLESDNEATIVEYAVKMRRLPQQFFLHTFIEDDRLSHQHFDRVANKLTDFYRSQQRDEDILQWGSIEKIRYNTDENFRQTRRFLGETIGDNSFKAVHQYTNQYLKRREGLFTQRIEENRIVDGHGDLHLEHIHISPDQVRIFDCIEFNDRFRYGDVAADLAYLAMDLDFNDCPKEERYFVKEMAQKLNDDDLIAHINFYKCYRAYVKGKVKSLQSSEEEVGEEDQKKARQTAADYFGLSLRYALLGSDPTVLVFMGRIATGKSTLAKYLSDKLDIRRFSSDRTRKTMMGLPLDQRPEASKRKELYSPKMSRKTYRHLLDEAEGQLEGRKSVIIDATFSRKEYRDKIIEIAGAHNANGLFVETCASDGTIVGRLKSRESTSGVVSDARLEDFKSLSQAYYSPAELSSTRLLKISTEPPIKHSIKKLYKKLINRHWDKETQIL